MSVQAMSDVLEHSPFAGATFLVHLLIADTVNEQNEYHYWAAQDYLAKKCRLTTRSVRRAITELVDAGYLVVVKRPGRYETVTYRFVFHERLSKSRPDTMSYESASSDRTPSPAGRTSGPDERTQCPTNPIEHKEPKLARSTKSNAGDDVAKAWYEEQDPKPLGGSQAFFALRELCRKAINAGHSPGHTKATLDRLGYIPSATIFDKELRNPRPESFSERKAREDREHAEKAAAMRRAQEEEDRQRRERNELEKANAVPMPDHVRERLAELGIGTKRTA